MTEIITVQNIVHPAPGKKQGKILDTMGRSWQVWADKIGQFYIGQTYEVLQSKVTNFNGATYVTIGEFRPLSGPTPSPTVPVPQAQIPITQASVVAPARAATPPSIGEAERRMDIFVCGAVNNMLSNANISALEVSPADLMKFITMLKEVWKRTLGPNANDYNQPTQTMTPPAPSQPPNDMNDEIPF